MFEQPLELGQKVLAYCHRKGMSAVEIYYSYNNTKQVSVNGKSIDKQLSKEELGAGIRVIHNGAEGFSYSNVLTEEALKKTANEAFSVAKLSPKIEGIGLPSKQNINN